MNESDGRLICWLQMEAQRAGDNADARARKTLRALERDGLVTRTVYPTVPVTVEYRLTSLGQSLTDAIDAIRDWAYGHMSEIELRATHSMDARPGRSRQRAEFAGPCGNRSMSPLHRFYKRPDCRACNSNGLPTFDSTAARLIAGLEC